MVKMGSKAWWLIFLLALGAVIIFCLSFFTLEENINKHLIDGVAIFGTAASLIGIIIAYSQIMSVKEVSEEIKTNVDNSLAELNEFLSFSDISSTIKQIREAQTFIMLSKPDLALILMRMFKSQLVTISHNNRLQEYLDKSVISRHISNLGSSILNIQDNILSGIYVDYTDIQRKLENIVTSLEEIVSKLKDNKI